MPIGMKLDQECGSPTRARTWDLRINSPSLYQLSYRGIWDVMRTYRGGILPQRTLAIASAT
jgi:hypothetical protein